LVVSEDDDDDQFEDAQDHIEDVELRKQIKSQQIARKSPDSPGKKDEVYLV